MTTTTTVDLETRDGKCRMAVVRPEDGKGRWPAVIFCIDGGGYRPTLLEMAERLAGHGYVVAMPDLFYRAGAYDPKELRAMIFNPETMPQWRARYYDPATKLDNLRTDLGAVLDYLAEQPDVAQPKVGTTGYCMGGRISLAAAGLFPERVAVSASFHGGFLAFDGPDSPHSLASQMKADVYIGGAIEDSSFPEAMKQKLDEALTKAGVDHVIEIYQARHGFAVADNPSYDTAAADQHWTALVGAFDRGLKAAG